MRTKYILNAKTLVILLLATTVGFTGCKKFLDVNENPNNPDSATPSLLLPTVEAAIGQIIGNNFQVIGGIWAQYWTQNPTASQYRTVEQYNMAATIFDRPWLTIYRNALVNAELIIKNTDPANAQYKGIAYLLKAYTAQVTTDAFGDIPLSEGLAGESFSNPHYDAQATVYDSIFSYINKGVVLLDGANSVSAGAQDLIFSGDVAKWKQFANTLKLRAYLRLSQVDPAKAQAGIAALYNTQPVFLAQDASIKYTTTGGNQNPLYNGMLSLNVQNIVASATAVKAMVANSDPRVYKFYDALHSTTDAIADDKDTISYIPQGAYAKNATKLVSTPSALVGGNLNVPTSANATVKLLSLPESYFLQAEALVRGWGTSTTTTATTAYTEGIRQSFIATGLTTAAADVYIATAPDAALPTTGAAAIKTIITQKYYAMNGTQGFEAWTEWRRTGYPTFFVTSAASTLGVGRMPLRFVYPSSESLTNANYPGSITTYTPVWWDK